jgi:hypothetical protein
MKKQKIKIKSSEGPKVEIAKATEIAVGDDKDLINGITEEEIENLTKIYLSAYCQIDIPEDASETFNSKTLKKIKRDLKKLSIKERFNTFIKAVNFYGLDSQILLAKSVVEHETAMNMSYRMTKEYGCKTPSEKAIVQIATNAYVRVMENSRIMKASRGKTITFKMIPYFAMISKELDRATRQYESALNTLIRMKTPSIEVNVTAKNAFVAEKQQFNINQKNNENIEPK